MPQRLEGEHWARGRAEVSQHPPLGAVSRRRMGFDAPVLSSRPRQPTTNNDDAAAEAANKLTRRLHYPVQRTVAQRGAGRSPEPPVSAVVLADNGFCRRARQDASGRPRHAECAVRTGCHSRRRGGRGSRKSPMPGTVGKLQHRTRIPTGNRSARPPSPLVVVARRRCPSPSRGRDWFDVGQDVCRPPPYQRRKSPSPAVPEMTPLRDHEATSPFT